MPVPAKLTAMLQNYPERAKSWESLAQIVLLISVLAIAGFYSTIAERAHEPEIEARLAVMMHALKAAGVAFLLALSATFLRRAMIQPPLVLIWAALLVVAVVAWAMSCLLLLSAL